MPNMVLALVREGGEQPSHYSIYNIRSRMAI